MNLDLTKITLNYQRGEHVVRAVHDVSLTVAAGEFVAIQGSSGAGKSSLLLVAGGLLRPTEGQVKIEGQDLYEQPSEQRAAFRAKHIGIIFQRFHLLPYLSVRQNILTPTLAVSLPDAEVRAEQLIAKFGLEHRSQHQPSRLSAGECQRVATARALLANPKVILADEPTGNLDRENSAIVLDAIRAAVDAGSAAILVTHDEQAAARADRVLHMRDSQITTSEQVATE
ncbi:MAG: ABC transporter ATP-binding protein [Planctomycetes bacterium]|nr:ABC transporter ATP-binding protein [Planctomycetota bacterium]